jgi:AAHS family 3-hydroxyphenylpropionic acid transporter
MIVATFEGVDLQAAGVAAPRLLPFFKLTSEQAGLFFASSTFGLLLGAPIAGVLADRFGRKIMLVLSVLLFGVFSAATGLASDFINLTAMRFLTGLGLGGALPNLISLVAESAPPERRSQAVGVMYAGMPLGGGVASLLTLVVGSDWRTIFFVGGAAPLLVVPVILLGLHDGYRQAAKSHERINLWRGLFGEARALPTLLLWTAFGLTLLVLYLLLNWLPVLLIGRGASKADAVEVQIVFNLAGMVGTVLAGRAMDGSRQIIAVLVSFIVTLMGLFLLGNFATGLWAALLAGAVVGVGIMSNQSVLYGLAPRLYPLTSRGAGVGAAVAIGRIGSVLGPWFAGQWIGAGQTAAEVFARLLPILAVAAFAAVLLSGVEQQRGGKA